VTGTVSDLADITAELRWRVAALADLPERLSATVEEPLSEYVVELRGLAVVGETIAGYGELLAVLRDDLAARLGLLPWPGALPRAAALLADLLPADRFDGVLKGAYGLLPDGLGPRLAYPADLVRNDVLRLTDIHRAEWCDGDPTVVAAGGAELVVRVARVLTAAGLVAWAARDDGPDSEVTARRYAWRWLRDPVPEAASPRHRVRTRELLRAL
jgi:hypothetical protein